MFSVRLKQGGDSLGCQYALALTGALAGSSQRELTPSNVTGGESQTRQDGDQPNFLLQLSESTQMVGNFCSRCHCLLEPASGTKICECHLPLQHDNGFPLFLLKPTGACIASHLGWTALPTPLQRAPGGALTLPPTSSLGTRASLWVIRNSAVVSLGEVRLSGKQCCRSFSDNSQIRAELLPVVGSADLRSQTRSPQRFLISSAARLAFTG